MSKKLTSKVPNFGNNVSHAHNKKKKKQNVNIQYTTINGVRFETSTREARTLRKLTK